MEKRACAPCAELIKGTWLVRTRDVSPIRSHGNCDFFLFPERHYSGDVPHSYIVEFKYLKKGAKKAELDAQRKEGVAQLKRYAKDKKIPALAKGTTLHLILVQYRGPKMCTCELVGEKRY